jgi:outer membrane protein, heavy metal efflux system
MKRIKHILIIAVSVIFIYTGNAFSQQDLNFRMVPISLDQFISNVAKGNLAYIAAKLNVNIAEAELQAAKVFPDPEISLAYSNNEDNKLQMGQLFDAGISYPINTGNQRKAGLAVAGTQLDLSRLFLESYFRNLKADAAKCYFTTLRNRKINELQMETYEQLRKLASADSIRLKIGEANEVDAVQTALEAKLQFHLVLHSQAELINSLINLVSLQGIIFHDTLYFPSGDFPGHSKEMLLSELLKKAMESRTDIMIAAKERELSERNLLLLKADRAFEFSLEAGYSYNSIVKNQIAPAPAYNSLNAGITIPLKFSSLNKGALSAIEYAIKRNDFYIRDVQLQIYSEVLTGYNIYISSRKRVESFDQQLIEDAEKILRSRIHAYQAGESGLVDVLNARQTYTSLRTSYIETLYEFSTALIDLERAAGIWDIAY